jgi:hypothetical protein
MCNKIKINVGVYIFKDNNIFIAYCPSLDLSGYGEDIDKAKESFDIVINEYIKTCSEKGTLESDLIHHGWKIGEKMQMPKVSTLMRKNSAFRELLDKVDYTKYSETYQPELA